MFDIEKMKAKGIDQKSIAIMEDINANDKKRESCTHHDFERIPKQGKWICKNCGCREGGSFVQGYMQGLEHGRGQQNGIERR